MADKAGVQMYIGGTISTSEALHALTAAIVSENGKPDWDDGPYDEIDVQTRILESIENGSRFTVVALEKNGATMDEIEDACRQHGIAFQTLGDRGASWDSFIRTWVPGMEEPHQIAGGMTPSIELKQVRQLLAKGDQGVEQLKTIVERGVGPAFIAKLSAPVEVMTELKKLYDGDQDETETSYAPRA